MAYVYNFRKSLHNFFVLAILICGFSTLVNANVELNEDNWSQILEGEWMVEFYAPWCPACNALAPAWKEMSTRAQRRSLKMRAASVDVTQSPGLSGRFVVTALPTIYHVNNREFRQYKGPRDVDSMLNYVEQGLWKQVEAIPSWKAPDSLQMGAVAHFFKLSQFLRGIHNMLMETYGLPTWGSYLIFAVATIFVGALLGLMLVCAIDLLYPPRRQDKQFVSAAEMDRLAKGDTSPVHPHQPDEDSEVMHDDLVDDAADNSDAEKHSPSDSSSEEEEATAAAGDPDAKTEVRKRRPRKAD